MKRPQSTHHDPRDRRRGIALIVAIICLTLTTAMTVSLVRLALTSHQQVGREHWRVQSVWLAESGLSRAAARLTADGQYTGEEWAPAKIGPNSLDGHVTINVAADPRDASRVVVTATSDFPADPTDRVRTTRTLKLLRRSEHAASQSSQD